MRIALKPVSGDSTTTDATAAKSSGGSFLDILTQGTQDAVQAAKGAGTQSQSDAHSSSQNNADDTPSQESSTQTTPRASTPGAKPQTQTASSNNATGTQQSQHIGGATPATPAQSLGNVSVFLSPAAQSDKEVIVTEEAQAAGSAADQTVPSGKQAGATKGTQGKQGTPTSTSAKSSSALQQMLAALQQALPIPEAVIPPVQAASGSTQAQSQQNQTASSATAMPALAVDSVAQGIVQFVANQSAQNATGTQSSAPQGRTDSSTSSAPSTGSQFQPDLTAATASAVNALVANPLADSSAVAQASSQKPAQASVSAASTYLSVPLTQNDAAPTPTAARVIPFKISAANVAAQSSTSGSAAAYSTGASAASASAVVAPAAKSNSSSGTSSGDSQSGNTTASQALADNSTSTIVAFRVTDPAAVQTTALGAASHQASSTSSPDDGTAAHSDEGHNLPSAPGSLPAGSSAINSARVIQSMSETEMRVGMRSTEFGDISIRTSVTQQQMQAQISVDHSELVSALSAHIPAVQAKLGADYGLHASIEVSQGGASFSGNQGQSSQRDYKPSTPFAQIDGMALPTEPERAIARPVAATVAEGSRLDIRA